MCVDSYISSDTLLFAELTKGDIIRGCAGVAQIAFSSEEWVPGVGLVGRTHIRGVESVRVRRGRIVIVRRVWNIPVTAADTRVGDADVSRRSEGGVTTPPLVWRYPPFLGR